MAARTRWRTMACVGVMIGSLLGGACSSRSSPRTDDQIDAKALQGLVDDWVATSDQDKAVRAVLVQVGGKRVVERYYGGAGRRDHWDVQSVTKSVLSLLVGIAVEEEVLPGLDSTLEELLPERRSHMSLGMGEVTLEQLLTMTAGTEPVPQQHERVIFPRGSWVNHMLRTPLSDRGSFVYSNVASHLVAASLRRAIGGSTLDYARSRLFGPLGIDTTPADENLAERTGLIDTPTPRFGWSTDPEGIHTGPLGLAMSAAELLKVGQLVLNGGVWDGQQLVPERWIREATRSHVRPPDRYGYHWWVMEAAGEDAFAAEGFGGQLVQVVPALDLVTVVVCAIPFPASMGPDAVRSFASLVIAPEVARVAG